MSLFVAVQCGIYRHNVIGVFSSFDKAVIAAEIAIVHESDHYHTIQILYTTVDTASLGVHDMKLVATCEWSMVEKQVVVHVV